MAKRSGKKGGSDEETPEPGELSYDGRPIGYKHPPKRTQFQKGQPKPKGSGRKKDRQNTKQMVREVMAMPVTVTENGRKRTMSTKEAVLRKARANALSSDKIIEQKRFIDLMTKLDPDSVPTPDPYVFNWILPGDENL